ncbi:MAG: zinc dependent phospholipase C family protein [Candidatus Promineifilaceae bacterium]|nr:zinc dependent phospholipase C family protein [Candidatus Promineifilaceae bacterium]
MPTPFMHLHTAELILGHDGLTPVARKGITAERSAFLLGNIAPDFQVLYEIPRQHTHFYELPPRDDEPPYCKMLSQYPSLAEASLLDLTQSVFLAGYMVHLLLDWRWYQKILIPYFVDSGNWSGRRQRFVAHTALLTYMDGKSLARLSADVSSELAEANPGPWLPFAERAQLEGWQGYVAEQLLPGAEIKTTAIFARRLGLAAEELVARLQDPDWMQSELFTRVPEGAVVAHLHDGVDASVALLNDYLALHV